MIGLIGVDEGACQMVEITQRIDAVHTGSRPEPGPAPPAHPPAPASTGTRIRRTGGPASEVIMSTSTRDGASEAAFGRRSDPLALSVEEAAVLLGISRDLAYDLVHLTASGGLPA
jgi:hypothetical protein